MKSSTAVGGAVVIKAATICLGSKSQRGGRLTT